MKLENIESVFNVVVTYRPRAVVRRRQKKKKESRLFFFFIYLLKNNNNNMGVTKKKERYLIKSRMTDIKIQVLKGETRIFSGI